MKYAIIQDEDGPPKIGEKVTVNGVEKTIKTVGKLIEGKVVWIEACPICKDPTYYPEKDICTTCGHKTLANL